MITEYYERDGNFFAVRYDANRHKLMVPAEWTKTTFTGIIGLRPVSAALVPGVQILDN